MSPCTITRVDLSTRMLIVSAFNLVVILSHQVIRSRMLRSRNLYRHPSMLSYALAAATTFSAASFMVSATMKFNPDCFRISRPASTFVPSSRSTIGS